MKLLKTIMVVSILSTGYAYIRDSVGVPMRDGIHLGTDIYYPVTSLPPWPTLLQRTPYDRGWDSLYIFLITDVFGYVLAVQNVRGYGDSEGEPMVFLSDGWGELQDGYDAIEWIADRLWSDGKIGMIGVSAHGMTQYYAAGAQPPHLVCCAPTVAAPSLYHQCAFNGGEFRKALVETWLQGVGTPWLIDTVCNHPNYDSIWSVVNLREKYDVANYPMFHISGWFDLYTDGQLEAFSELQSRFHNQKLFMGPWGHYAFGAREQGDLVFPPNAELNELDMMNMLLEWYDYWMKNGGGPVPPPKVKFYLMGDCDTQDTTYWNHWVTADTWPLPDVNHKSFYLRENGLLDTFPPLTDEIDTFIYDPANPCTTYGGREYIGLDHGYGPIDQRPIENRSDVLIYSTPPLPSPLTVTGKLTMVLYAASDRYDTDWTVRVTDVYPDGRSILVTDHILMARHRHGFDREDSLIPDVPDTFIIDLWSTAYVFNAGHRLRVILSSSNYPRFEKNPNTGNPFKRDDSVFVVATQKIYRTTTMPSHIIIPVLPSPVYVKEKNLRNCIKTKIEICSPSILISSRVRLYTDTEGKQKIFFHIYDPTGRKSQSFTVKVKKGYNYIKLNEIRSGTYFIRLNKQRKGKKIIILK
jgi:hypothetical protein